MFQTLHLVGRTSGKAAEILSRNVWMAACSRGKTAPRRGILLSSMAVAGPSARPAAPLSRLVPQMALVLVPATSASGAVVARHRHATQTRRPRHGRRPSSPGPGPAAGPGPAGGAKSGIKYRQGGSRWHVVLNKNIMVSRSPKEVNRNLTHKPCSATTLPRANVYARSPKLVGQVRVPPSRAHGVAV